MHGVYIVIDWLVNFYWIN